MLITGKYRPTEEWAEAKEVETLCKNNGWALPEKVKEVLLDGAKFEELMDLNSSRAVKIESSDNGMTAIISIKKLPDSVEILRVFCSC